MASDKIYRILSMYIQMSDGGVIDKEKAADRYDVNQRSIQRDIMDIREFMEKKTLQGGSKNTVIFDRARRGYRFKNAAQSKLDKSEILAICKILLSSKAFTKKEMDVLIDGIIDGCAYDDSVAELSALVEAERKYYTEPYHRTNFIGRIWDLGEAVYSRRAIDIVYRRVKNGEEIRRRIKPVSLMFNDMHFYLVAYISEQDMLPEYEGESCPITYRIDRIERYTVLDQHFAAPYAASFEEDEFLKRASFVDGGSLKKVLFRYSGPSIEPVIDHIPTAKILSFEDGIYTFSAEAFGRGLDMWLKSQGDAVEIIQQQSI